MYESVVTLIRLLEQAGASDAWIERATGIAPAHTREPDARVPVSQLERLWACAAEQLRHPGLALELHRHYPEHKLHFVAHLGMRCPDLRSAIEHWRRYATLVCEVDEIECTVEAGTACFSYRCLDPRHSSRWLAEHYLSMAVWLAQLFTGRALPLHEVRFLHADPGCAHLHARAFGAPVQFAAGENSLRFDAAVLDCPLPTADSYLRHFLVERADQLKALLDHESGTEQRVVSAISMLLERTEDVTLERVGELLGQSPRRLRQALEAEGRGFRDLVDELRREAAARYLTLGLPIVQVAARLGFSAPSALQHAFRRWYRTSPGDFRQRLSAHAAGPARRN